MTDLNLIPYVTTPDNAARMADWLRTRDGIALWLSEDLARPGQTLTTPVKKSTGEPATRPAWWVGATPALVITDPADVLIAIDREVKRFHVAIRLGTNGLCYKCSDPSSKRIRAAVARAGAGAYHRFDYETQEAVILQPVSIVPLLEFLAQANSPEPPANPEARHA